MIAITHVPAEQLDRCERTFVAYCEIDYSKAVQQHAAYCRLLTKCGLHVVTLNDNRFLADCAFVEDLAVVLDEVAVVTSMGVASRRGEVAAMERALQDYRAIERIELPAAFEGGDVLQIGRTLLVGRSQRSCGRGLEAFTTIVNRYGYRVKPIPVRGCLHLKTACTALDDGTLLVNPAWIDTSVLSGFRLVSVPEDEPWGANVLRLDDTICVNSTLPRTAEQIGSLGWEVHGVDISEFAKAEAGVTCLSVLLRE